jgi:hypothetical protein
MSDVKLSIAVLQQFAKLLDKLSEGQLADLGAGRAQLAFVSADATVTASRPRGTTRSASSKGRPSTREAASRLSQATSREEAENYLREAGLLVPDLRAVARELQITLRSRKKDDIIRELVEGAVGYKQKFRAVMGGDWEQ